MSSLSNIWTAVESARFSQEVKLKETQEFVGQIVLLLGQASNSISYSTKDFKCCCHEHSHDSRSIKILRDGSELLQKYYKNLFEKKLNIRHKEWRHSIRKNDIIIVATKAAMDTDIVNINQETLITKVKFPYLVLVEDLKHIHLSIISLFCARKIRKVEQAWRLTNFKRARKFRQTT